MNARRNLLVAAALVAAGLAFPAAAQVRAGATAADVAGYAAADIAVDETERFGTQRLEQAIRVEFPAARVARVDRDTTLVSYNGRCYDSPLLATRYRLARMRNPLEGLAHADLLFAVRRRFREARRCGKRRFAESPCGTGRARPVRSSTA